MTQLQVVYPWAIFFLSLAGSWHCAGMCGGILLMGAPKVLDNVGYHFGRLMGYLGLGGVAGYFGATLLQDYFKGWIPWGLGALLSLLLIGVGIFHFRGVSLLGSHWISSRLFKIFLGRFQRSWLRSIFIGFSSVFLPCGWLYGFVLLAVASKSPVQGGIILSSFWLGTVPALTSFFVIFKKMLPQWDGSSQSFLPFSAFGCCLSY